jgi:very-short-patch-repair endonuclease
MNRNLKNVKCKICGFETTTNGLATHLKCKHNLSTSEYVSKYGEFRPKFIEYNNRSETSNFECKICNQKYASERHLSYHIRIEHDISKKEYIINNILDGNIPKCKCGCGEDVTILEKGTVHYREYLPGHNTILSHTGTFRSHESKMKMRKSAISRMQNKVGVFYKSATSKAELELLEYIKSVYDGEIEHKNVTLLSGLELDIYLPEFKLAIELNGERFHSDLFKKKNYHINKTKECNKLGINLVHIWLSDWYSKTDIIKSQINNFVKKTKNKIYARECDIRAISLEDCNQFLKKNHLQGACISKIRYGLFYKDKLVEVISFGKLRNVTGRVHIQNSYELLRLCTLMDTIVIGGASKLYKFFIKIHNPSYILSFANRDWSVGNVYNKLNMIFKEYTSPGYFYSKGKQNYHRYKFQKHKLVKLGYDKNKTEYEIMTEIGYYRVWNTGNIVYEWYSK